MSAAYANPLELLASSQQLR